MGGRGDAHGQGQPERTAGSNRVRAAAARRNRCRAWPQRTASRRALAGMILAPRAQSGHAWPPALVIEPDSNDDSNTSDQRQQQTTTAHNARRSHANWGYVRPEKRKVVVVSVPLT
jgi:hypothetical protein